MKTMNEIGNANIAIENSTLIEMLKLVMTEKQEVGARFLVESPEAGQYYIYKMMVYPQTVGPAIVTTDEREMTRWEDRLTDAEFNSMRMHFHSHVDMAVNPSSVDIDHQTKIVQQLKDNDYYIFLIINKKLECHWDIYDKRNMIHYETKDVECYDLVKTVYPEIKRKGYEPLEFKAEPLNKNIVFTKDFDDDRSLWEKWFGIEGDINDSSIE